MENLYQMTPRKKEIVEDSTNQIEEKLDNLNKALDLKLEDLDGIGSVRLKKLYSNGIYTVDDLLSRGEEELVRMLDITWDEAKKMIITAHNTIKKGDVFSNMIVKGGAFMKYRKEKIKYLTTGLPELDSIMQGGYETGVITEIFGAFGSGKTQFMTVACIMAQLPKEACCLKCGKLRNNEGQTICSDTCDGIMWEGGGLSEFGKPCRVVYIDTENSFRPDRLMGIVYNRGLVKTKPQTKTEEKQCKDKEPLNDEEYEKAYEFVNNVDVLHPLTSAMQMAVVENLSSMIAGEFCPECSTREINEEGLPTHQNHPKAKPDMKLLQHDFRKDKIANLVIVDSIIAEFRKDFQGRGELSDRQTKLKTHIKHLVRTTENKNVVCLITNQIQEALGVMGDNVRPVGGNEIAHTATHIIYLKKPQSMTKDKMIAILIDSPNNAKNEVPFELGGKGIQKQTE